MSAPWHDMAAPDETPANSPNDSPHNSMTGILQSGTSISTSSREPEQQAMTPYVNNDSYTYRVPSPPRIYVPPPGIAYHKGFVSLDQTSSQVAQLQETTDDENLNFLQKVTCGDFMPFTQPKEWSYEDRRKGQKILPFLYLAPYSAARDREYLAEERFTMLVGVREKRSVHFLNPTKITNELGIQLVGVDVSTHQELIGAFPNAINTINDHLLNQFNRRQLFNLSAKSSLGKVLVFCETGNERSAMLVSAYLMTMLNFDLITAVQTIQGQRFCVTFDDSTKHCLRSYEMILQARRQVDQAKQLEAIEANASLAAGDNHTTSMVSKGKQKRGHDNEEDTAMGGTDGNEIGDDERFLERKTWVPFADKQ